MEEKKMSNLLMKLIFTKEGKTWCLNIIKAFLFSWSENNKIKKFISSILLRCFVFFVKPKSEDASIKEIINDRGWWEQIGGSIMENLKKRDLVETKEYLEIIKDNFPETIKKIANDIWLYPSKVVVLLSCIPTIINFIFYSIVNFLKPINEQSPDLIADVMTSILNEIDSTSLGKIFNELSELLRKFDTGDELIKESSKTPFEIFVERFIGDITDNVDITLKKKLFRCILSLSEKVQNSVEVVFSDRPDDLEVIVNFLFLRQIQKIKHKRILLSQYSANEYIDIPVEEIAYFINAIFNLFINIRQNNKDLFDSILNRLFNSLDANIFYDFLNECHEELYELIQPVLSVIFPIYLNWITNLLNEEDEEIQNARRKFVKALLKDEQ